MGNRWRRIGALALVGLVMAACGEGRGGGEPESPPPEDPPPGTPECLGGQRFGGPNFNDQGVPRGARLAVDPSGAAFIGGTFQGPLDFGGATYLSAGGSRDVFLARVDERGRAAWAQRFGDPAEQRLADIAATPDGGVLVTGYFRGTLDLGGAVLHSTREALFLARLDAAGGHVWSRSFEGDDVAIYGVNAVGAAPDGGALLFGSLEGELDFGGLSLQNGGVFPFLVRFDAGGTPRWGKTFTGSVDQTPLDVGADRDGNVYIAEEAKYSLIDGLLLQGDAFANTLVASFTPLGVLRWAKIFRERPAAGPTGEPDTFPSAMAVDPRGGMFVAGVFSGTLDLGAGPISAGRPNEYAGFVVRFDRNGRAQWSLAVPGASIASIDVDGSGDALVTGGFTGTIDLGGARLTSAGGDDVLAASLARADGRAAWSARWGDAADQRGTAVAAAPGRSTWVTGIFAGALDLGCGPLTSASDRDLFLAKITR